MNKHTLTFLSCNFNEVIYILCCLIIRIEQYLRLYILPEERQIDYSESFPLVLYLFARAINYSRHFVHLDKVEVLNIAWYSVKLDQ